MAVNAILGKKIGMTQVYREDGSVASVTAIQAGPCHVTQVKTRDNDGYEGVQLGFEPVKRRSKPVAGHIRGTGKSDTLFRYLREVDAGSTSEVEVGQQVDVSMFQPGDRVDATGTSKGRGFAGGVRRYNFRGGPKTHGQSDRHRAPGSIGAGTFPGRVLKGQPMAGHMGDARVTVRNLEVVEADAERNILFIKGAIPGARGSLVLIRKAGAKGE